jgi:putative ABC transport system permease protein
MSNDLPRESRSFMWFEDLGRDLAFGVRTLLKTPAFTLVAVLTLALGISAVTVIYSVLRNVALDPFPYSRSDRLVNVVLRDNSGRIIRGPYFRSEEFLDYQEQTTAFEDVVGTSQFSAHWMSDSGAERLALNWMTPNGFDFLGVPPLLGRVFGYSDVAPGAPPVAVMNHRAWVTRFGADPGVIGRTLVLDGQPYTVIGVMPPRFEWNIADLWLPAAMQRSDDPQTPRGARAFQAHLRPGVTAAEAEAQLNVVGARRAAERPNEYPAGFRFGIIPVVDWVVREFRGTLYALFGAVSLLLVIACCNVANMLLARATIREREMTIRAAIGASRGRLVRQLLAESAVLACGGVGAGCLLAYGGIVALAGYMPRQGVPWETQIRLDRPVLLFALAAAAVATIAFGLFPALQSARRDIALGANTTARSTAGRRQTRMRSGLVVAQVALSIVLLLGAGLLMRTFVNLVRVDLGLDPKNMLVAGVAFPPGEQMSAEAQLQFYRRAIERVGSIPGVSAAALTSVTPPFGGSSSPLEIPGLAVPPQSATLVTFVSEQLLATLGTPLLQGRGLTALEVENKHLVTVVNETLAKRYLGGAPLGRTVRLSAFTKLPVPVTDPTFVVVGVVRDVSNQGPRELPMPQVFVPFTFRSRALTLVVRTGDDPTRLSGAVKREFQALDPRVALVDPTPLQTVLDRVLFARPRFNLLVLGIFATIGTVLVTLGVYGVLAYTVAQQTREIAIRLALGGERGHVVRMVLRLGLRMVAVGLGIGLAMSVVTNRLLQSELWGTTPTDPTTFAAAILVTLATGLVASFVPAWRAVRVEPMVALRHE